MMHPYSLHRSSGATRVDLAFRLTQISLLLWCSYEINRPDLRHRLGGKKNIRIFEHLLFVEGTMPRCSEQRYLLLENYCVTSVEQHQAAT